MICYLFTQTIFHLRSLSANHRLLHAFSWDDKSNITQIAFIGSVVVTNANYMLETLFPRFCIHACNWCITEKFSHTSKRHHTHVDFTRHSARCVNIKEILPTKTCFMSLNWFLAPNWCCLPRKREEGNICTVFFLSNVNSDVLFAKPYY